MLGTLNGALEVRRVVLEPDAIRAEVRGINEIRDRLPVLTRVEVAYTLRIPPGTRGVVERALARHQEKCPHRRHPQGGGGDQLDSGYSGAG